MPAKKILTLSCALAVMAALTGCGSSKDDNSDAGVTSPASSSFIVRPSSYAHLPDTFLSTITAIRVGDGTVKIQGYVGAQRVSAAQDPLIAPPFRLTVRFYNPVTLVSYGSQTSLRNAARTTDSLDGSTDKPPVWYYGFDFPTHLNIPAGTSIQVQILDDGNTSLVGDELASNHVQLFVGDPLQAADNAHSITVTTIVAPGAG